MWASLALAQPHSSSHLVTQSAALRFNSAVPESTASQSKQFLKYYLVPEQWTRIIADPEVAGSWMTFLKDAAHPGFVRLPIHPFDFETSKWVEYLLKEAGYSAQAYTFERPHLLTESRSLYPVDVAPGQIAMSPRLSITDGMGKWGGREVETDQFGNRLGDNLNKLILPAHARFSLETSRLAQRRMGGVAGRFFEIQPDRMALIVEAGVSGSNPQAPVTFSIGATFRDIRSATRPNHILVPGFVGQHPRGSLILALANGRSTPFEYIEQVEAPIRGRAWAEFYALTGFVHGSPHSQNVLLETDDWLRLTGLMGVRDSGDFMIEDETDVDPMILALANGYQQSDALRRYLEISKTKFIFRHSFAKGNNKLSLTDDELRRVELVALEAFVKQMSVMSGVAVDELKGIAEFVTSSLRTEYAMILFDRQSAIWQRVQAGLKAYRANFIREKSRSGTRAERSTKSGLKADIDEPLARLPEIRNFFLRLLLKAFKDQAFSLGEVSYAHRIWQQRHRYDLRPHEIHWLTNALVATRMIPPGAVSEILRQIQSPMVLQVYLEDLLILEQPTMLIEALRTMAESRPAGEYNLPEFHLSVMRKLESSKQPIAVRAHLAEALYFALMKTTKSEYRSLALSQMELTFSKLGFVPESVRQDLEKALRSAGESWTIGRILALKSECEVVLSDLL
ncbi:MAG: hypothetical protein AB7G93_14500 [Bdellovibrionales bacterium]